MDCACSCCGSLVVSWLWVVRVCEERGFTGRQERREGGKKEVKGSKKRDR